MGGGDGPAGHIGHDGAKRAGGGQWPSLLVLLLFPLNFQSTSYDTFCNTNVEPRSVNTYGTHSCT